MKKYSIIIWLLLCAVQASAQTDPGYPSPPAAAQNIAAAEYFIDTDPGFGNATPISITTGLNLSNVISGINTTGLTNGVHRVYLRGKEAGGKWSITNVQSFIVDFDPAYPSPPVAAQNITAAEYFMDTDPGLGNATPISVIAGMNLNNVSVNVHTTGLANGVHRVYLRSKEAGEKWSITNVQSFIVDFDPAYPSPPVAAQNITAAEYFIDTDPSAGNATPISVTTGVNLSNVSVNVNTTGITNGVHRVYLRSKEAGGKWSVTNVQNFTVDIDPVYPVAPAAAGNITYAEYFFDADPGFGNGTSIAITPGVDLNNITFSANTAALNDSIHTLFIRSIDDWSITSFTTFTKGTPLPLDFLSFTAAASGNDVLLNWTTANKSSTAHFDIEFCKDSESFKKIVTQKAANEPGTQTYQYMHTAPGDGSLYYRLRQVDENGSFRYSRVAVVHMDSRQKKRTILYPNPTTNSIAIKNIHEADVKAVQITTVDGKVVLQANATAALEYNVSSLSSGTYYVSIQKTNGTMESLAFVKQ